MCTRPSPSSPSWNEASVQSYINPFSVNLDDAQHLGLSMSENFLIFPSAEWNGEKPRSGRVKRLREKDIDGGRGTRVEGKYQESGRILAEE